MGLIGANIASLGSYYLNFRVRDVFSRMYNLLPGQRCSTPGTTNLANTMKHVGAVLGYETEVRGIEHLKEINQDDLSGNALNVFLPTHVHGHVDLVSGAQAPLKHFFSVVKTSEFPSLLRRMVSNVNEIIPKVDDRTKSTSVSQMQRERLKAGASPNLVVFSSGVLSDAGEIAYPNSRFVGMTLDPIVDTKPKAKLIPITFDTDSGYLAYRGWLPDTRKSIVTIHKPLNSGAAKFLVKFQVENELPIVDQYLVTLWYETKTHNKELSLEDMIRRSDKNLKFSLPRYRDLTWDALKAEAENKLRARFDENGTIQPNQSSSSLGRL